jgi:hypothetical protein
MRMAAITMVITEITNNISHSGLSSRATTTNFGHQVPSHTHPGRVNWLHRHSAEVSPHDSQMRCSAISGAFKNSW